MSSDKKSDDYYPQNAENGEKERFVTTSANFSSRSAPAIQLPESISKISNSPGISVLAYCLSSISMTVVNKYVVSGSQWNLMFLYLAIQVSDFISLANGPNANTNRGVRIVCALQQSWPASSWD